MKQRANQCKHKNSAANFFSSVMYCNLHSETHVWGKHTIAQRCQHIQHRIAVLLFAVLDHSTFSTLLLLNAIVVWGKLIILHQVIGKIWCWLDDPSIKCNYKCKHNKRNICAHEDVLWLWNSLLHNRLNVSDEKYILFPF